jgi:TonB family protein
MPRYLFIRKFLLTLVLCGVAAELSAAFGQNPAPQFPEANAQNWKEFKSAGGQFTVLMPGVPAEERLAKYDNVVMHLFNLRTNAEYAVGYADYAEAFEGTERITAFMDRVRDGGVMGIGGTLVEWKDLPFEGHPGRVYKVEFGGGYVMNSKIVVVKNRLYMIAATTYGSKAPADIAQIYETAAAKFLNSFKLTSANTTEPEGEVDKLLTGTGGRAILKACLPPRDFCQGNDILVNTIKAPKPEYPAIARAAHASGPVVLRVVANEEGKVVAVQVISGHPLLQATAVRVARETLFSRPVAGGKPVKIVGELVYNFVAN